MSLLIIINYESKLKKLNYLAGMINALHISSLKYDNVTYVNSLFLAILLEVDGLNKKKQYKIEFYQFSALPLSTKGLSFNNS